jgi:pseudouridine synthase
VENKDNQPTPEDKKPITPPKARKPAAKPAEKKAATTPKAKKPVAAPAEKKAATTPKAKKPVAAPAEKKAATTPKVEKPVSAPVEKKAATTPKAKKPVAAPVEKKAATTPKAKKPVAAPAEKKAATTPKAKKPVAAPAEKKAVTTPKAKKPVAAPAEKKAVTTPPKVEKPVTPSPPKSEKPITANEAKKPITVVKNKKPITPAEAQKPSTPPADKKPDTAFLKKETGDKSMPLRGKKAAAIRKAAESVEEESKDEVNKLPSGLKWSRKERDTTPGSKKKTESGGKRRTPAAVKKAVANEKRAVKSQNKPQVGPKRPDGGKKSTAAARSGGFGKFVDESKPRVEKKNDRRKEKLLHEQQQKGKKFQELDIEMRLNRYIALSGVCSRREADTLIAGGKIKVNGKVCTEMGHKVTPGKDKVEFNRRELQILKFVYLLMNKPKNLITTTKDDLGRSTVMDLVEKYTKVRIYPVGRLDRNTTGLILFTNDGDLAKRLTHPSHKFKKMYHVRLDKDLTEEHFLQLRTGIELEDGPIKADKIEFVAGGGPNEVGVELHSGRNRIVRRMFESQGYEVVGLDRVKFGPLSKKNLPRGTCRFLDEKEVGFLKMAK